jgi:hypothetical protein
MWKYKRLRGPHAENLRQDQNFLPVPRFILSGAPPNQWVAETQPFSSSRARNGASLWRETLSFAEPGSLLPNCAIFRSHIRYGLLSLTVSFNITIM